MDSPPKRMTRARAAAKASAVSTNTTRIVTAAAKARSSSTATGSTKSTAAKRKTRADEKDDAGDDLADRNTRRAVRARPGTNDEPSGSGIASTNPASAKNPRTRVLGRATIATTAASHNNPAPVRTRGRGRNGPSDQPIQTNQENGIKVVCTRTSAAKKAAAETSKPPARRTVKFHGLGKENMSLAAKAEEAVSDNAHQGLRGRPTRRGTAAVPDRPSKSASKLTEIVEKKPLSPKKVTQMPLSRDRESSEDELANGEGAKAALKSPARTNERTEADSAENEVKSPRDATKLSSEFSSVVFGSPPRRPPTSPPKESLKSPAKRIGGVQLLGSNVKTITVSYIEQDSQPSLARPILPLRSPAKRPSSPIKGLNLPAVPFDGAVYTHSSFKSCFMLQTPAKRAMPGASPLRQVPKADDVSLAASPRMQPIIASTVPIALLGRPSKLLLADESEKLTDHSVTDSPFGGTMTHPRFPGQMCAVLSRQKDSSDSVTVIDEATQDVSTVLSSQPILSPAGRCEKFEDHREERSAPCPRKPGFQLVGAARQTEHEDFMNLEELINDMEETGDGLGRAVGIETTVAQLRSDIHQLRDDMLDPESDMESEDDLSPLKNLSASRFSQNRRTSSMRDSVCGTRRHSRRSTLGLASLGEQFGTWSAASIVKEEQKSSSKVEVIDSTSVAGIDHDSVAIVDPTPSPIKNNLFEDEIVVHTDPSSSRRHSMRQSTGQNKSDDAISREDIAMLDEDVALAEDAKNISLMSQQLGEASNILTSEETLSEASQEYGDENEMPIDPALSGRDRFQITTPAQPLRQTTFFTTTKVPLKPADDSEPSPLKKRSFSASRAAVKNAGNLPRCATAISYSPTKEKRRVSILPSKDVFSSPSKGDLWSSVDTPGRTPRRDIDPALLRGAIVLVDVHTTEGADASGIFVELLTHMGAKCVKSWHWNPNVSGDGDSSSGKVGITHVVFKDGGKRTMEKVREAGGIVHCVGVSWVLDCERENEWLDEAPYCLDTSVIPRGGSRRRKSMEPRAIANMNGTIVSSTNKTSGSPRTPKRRRESTLWMRTPPEQGDEDNDEDPEWSRALLTPVPKTPAPEAVAKYASELPETPSSQEESELMSPSRQSLLTRTCPPKEGKYHNLGDGILSCDIDEQVLMRLMAVRRKSLQFAPKIGSPLARTWD